MSGYEEVFNTMNNTSDTDIQREKINDFYLILFEGIFILLTVFGNGLLLCSICTHKTLRSRSNTLVANLAISDFLIGGTALPSDVITKILSEAKKDKFVCLLHNAFFVGFVGASVLSLFFISLERYSAIMSPLKYYTNASRTSPVVSVTTVWIVSISLGIVPLLGWNSWQPGVLCKSEFVYFKGYIYLVLTLYIALIITSIILYVIVVRKILKQIQYYEKGRAGHNGRVSINRNYDSFTYKNIKKTKIRIFVLGVFAFCWAPFTILTILKAYFISESRIVTILGSYFAALGLLNSGLNWIVFGLLNNSMRKAFKDVLLCSYNRKMTVSTVSSNSNAVNTTC